MDGIKLIRVERENEVSHYSTKYYTVVYNEDLRMDELILQDKSKRIAQVKPVTLFKGIITYKEICKH